KKDNYTIVIITHKLNEIKAICDRVTILRHGKNCGVYQVKTISLNDISRLMIGFDINHNKGKASVKRKRKILSVNTLEIVNNRGEKVVDNISFDAFEGEILCFAGVEGNGQNETIQCLAGLNQNYRGQIIINKQNISKMSIAKIRSLGVSYISEDRMMQGVNQEDSIMDNLINYKLNKKEYVKAGFINYRKLKAEAVDLLKNYDVKYDNLKQPIKMLSGGNIQKIVIARELENEPLVIIANQPTRGVDVGAIELIHQKLINLRDKHKLIILVSADLNEVFNLADRIIVFYNGKITAEITDVNNLTEEELGLYMLGLKKQNKNGHINE
ncbi:MAG: ATP-binding cassette domain-containing protein, partial [Bacilli bacterium]|nr:ATP-binding cassette domain-containing protein [Bacilli bacterium]